MGFRSCLKNFVTKAREKEDLGIYCVKLAKLETLYGFLVVAEPLRPSRIKMLRKLKSLFLVKKKIQELMKVKEILEELLVYFKALSAEYADNPWV